MILANFIVKPALRIHRRVVLRLIYGARFASNFAQTNTHKALSQAGQTLIDLSVALALLALALGSAGILATTAARAGSEGGRRTQATTLATREIEALRNYRDTVARFGESWAGIPSGTCNPGSGASFVMQRATTGLDQGIYGTPWNITSSANPVAYTDADNAGYGTDYNGFSRLVTVCDMPGNSDEKSIQVNVSWAEGTHTAQVTFTTLMSNWK